MTDNDTGLYAHGLRKVHTQHVGKQKPRFFYDIFESNAREDISEY